MNERVDLQDAEITAALKMLGDALQKKMSVDQKKSFISLSEIAGALDRQLWRVKLVTDTEDLPSLIEALVDMSVISNLGIASILGMLRTKAIESRRRI